MALGKYFSKRQFKKTPEPHGHLKKTKSKKLVFVVQEHHASRLHYDFRIELDGVLKSWAIPKGPSLDPHEHHLAVQVEDHPYEYKDFEGTIPKGNYGAGNVIVWDKGTYEPYHDNPDDEATIRKELAEGHLTFFLHGKKLRGEFALIKMKKTQDNAWLFIKKGDTYATSKNVLSQDTSVLSGRTVDELGTHTGHVPIDLKGCPKVAKPWAVKPMLCTLVDTPFDDSEWLFEIKWDGYRAIGVKHASNTALYSRAHTDFSQHYPSIREALHALHHNVILDGEIVAVDKNGMPHFEALQNWRTNPIGQLQYQVFDILWCDGYDVRSMPLIERKKLLQSILPPKSPLRFGDDIPTQGIKLFHEIQKRGLEGIVAKKAHSMYRENSRGGDWLKIKTHLRQEVVIGGFTEPRGSRQYLGSLIVGVYEGKDLVYVGHSGGGIPDTQRKKLREQLEKIERKTSPFSKEPKANEAVHWVAPELVCEMSFSEWTSDGRMRQPVFKGMRVDKKPRQVVREKPKH